MTPIIQVDANKAFARFSPAGIPEQVRRNLRRTLPDLAKLIGSRVDSKLDLGLKSRNRLRTKTELVENPTTVIGRVRVVWTGDQAKKMVPWWLDQGTRPHIIAARLAPSLYFFWEKMGKYVAFKMVYHPGFKGLHFIEAVLGESEPEIVDVLTRAVKEGAAE